MTERLTADQRAVFERADHLIAALGPAFATGVPQPVAQALELARTLGREGRYEVARVGDAIVIDIHDDVEEIGVWSWRPDAPMAAR